MIAYIANKIANIFFTNANIKSLTELFGPKYHTNFKGINCKKFELMV